MKEMITIFMISLIALSIRAQIEKGSVSLEGGALIQNQWSEFNALDGTNIGFNPSASFMLSDRLLVGGALGVGIYSNNGNTNWGHLVQPEVRYYITPQSDKNKYFLGAVGGFDITEFDNSTFSFNAGLSRFINESIALEAIASYQLNREAPNGLLLSLNFRSFISKEVREDWKENGIRTFHRGDWMIGRSIGLVGYVLDRIQLQLSPTAAYFLNERLAIGAEVNAFSSIHTEDNTIPISSLTLTPFARLYLSKPQKWRWFSEIGISYNRANSKVGDSFTSTSYSFSTRGRLGTNIFLAPNLALELFVEGNYYFGTNLDLEYVEPLNSPNSPFPREDFRGFLSDRRFELSGGISLRYFISRAR